MPPLVQSLESEAGSQRLRTSTSTKACIRCRQKKKRCDQKLPRCRLCDLAGVECFGYEPSARRQVPRSYVQSLEERVAYLEAQLDEHASSGQGNTTSEDSSTHSPASGAPQKSSVSSDPGSLESLLGPAVSPDTHDIHHSPGMAARSTLDRIAELSHQQQPPEAEFSRILLKEMLSSKSTPQQDSDSLNCSGNRPSTDIAGDLDTRPVTLPTRDAAKNLVNEYFQCSSLSLPLLHQPSFMEKFDLVYDKPDAVDLTEMLHTDPGSKIAAFLVLEVFAIALLTMNKQDPTRIPTWLADRYHKKAIAILLEAGLPKNTTGVQALLLVGQFYYFHPTTWAVWNTVGAALRLAVEIGLNHDPPPGEYDALTLDIRRRTFWAAYSMERNISIAQSMPSCLSDGAISAQCPSPVEDRLITHKGIDSSAECHISGSKLISLQLLRYRQIQSEMRTVLTEKPPPPHRPINLDEWQEDMCDRITKWYRATPPRNNANAHGAVVIETLELTYHTGLFYLYHPAPNNPSPSPSQWIAMAKSAMRMISLLRKFFLERKLTIYWQAVENLTSAGTALMAGYVNSPELRDYITLRTLETTLHSCSSVLWGTVERFPAFQGRRDAFDLAVSTVLADLNGSATGTSISMGGIQDEPVHAATPGTTIQPDMQASLFMDFGSMANIWDATMDWTGTPTPTWT